MKAPVTTLRRPKVDRRGSAQTALPACDSCGHAAGEVIARTGRSLYVQCARCRHVQSIPTAAGTGKDTHHP